jgi:hypothetical protein
MLQHSDQRSLPAACSPRGRDAGEDQASHRLEHFAAQQARPDLILAFVDRVSTDSDVKGDWRRYEFARRDRPSGDVPDH